MIDRDRLAVEARPRDQLRGREGLGGQAARIARRPSGEAVAGIVGAEERYEYTVIGDPVNVAARLTEVAKTRPGRVLANEHAVRVAGEEAAAWNAGTS